MNTKVTLNTHGLLEDDRKRFRMEIDRAVEIHNLLAQFTISRAIYEGTALDDQIIRIAAPGDSEFDQTFEEHSQSDFDEMLDSSSRMASSIRILRCPTAMKVVLECVWFGRFNQKVGSLTFLIQPSFAYVRFLPGSLAANLRGG